MCLEWKLGNSSGNVVVAKKGDRLEYKGGKLRTSQIFHIFRRKKKKGLVMDWIKEMEIERSRR